MKTLFAFLSTLIVITAHAQTGLTMRTLPMTTAPSLGDTMIIQSGGKTKAVRLSSLAPLFSSGSTSGTGGAIASFNGRVGVIVPQASDYSTYYAAVSHNQTFSTITATPTTLAGYGITDAMNQTTANGLYAPITHNEPFSSVTGKPTTLNGYGITDAAPLTHTQLAATITDFNTATDARITTQKNVPNGVAGLDANGKISATAVSPTDTVHFDPTTKQDVLQSGVNIKTYNGQSILGSGNLTGGSGSFDSLTAYTTAPTATGKNTYFDLNTHKIGVKVGSRWLYFSATDSVSISNVINQNLITWSEEFDNASWTKVGGGTITANTTVAPDGTTTADRYTAGVGAFAGILRKPFVYSNGTYIGSVYLKRVNWNYIGLRVAAGAGTGAELWGTNTPFIDLNDNSVFLAGAPATTAIHVTNVGGGWVRLDVSYTISGSTGTLDYFDICVVDNNGEISTARAGTEQVDVWGADLNTTSLKNYSKTTSTANP